jgi:glycosyltransferase involved in cell wall biosynthesis
MSAIKLLLIGIPTYKRRIPLEKLLRSINLIDSPESLNIEILIADNQGLDGEAKYVAEYFTKESKFRFPISVIGVEERGISYVRNAILENSFVDTKADFLVMVDDDEVVSSCWITELLKIQDDVDADIVGGLKTPVFEIKPAPWMPLNDAYFYQPSDQNGRCDRLVSTDNLLITREAYLKFGKPQFDLDFALTGGGDTEFLHRLEKKGAKLAFSLEALTHEIVPKERMTERWARQRARRIGIGLARIYLLHCSPMQIATQILKLLTILTASTILYWAFIFSSTRRFNYLTLRDKQLGKILGLFGFKVFPYMDQ